VQGHAQADVAKLLEPEAEIAQPEQAEVIAVALGVNDVPSALGVGREKLRQDRLLGGRIGSSIGRAAVGSGQWTTARNGRFGKAAHRGTGSRARAGGETTICAVWAQKFDHARPPDAAPPSRALQTIARAGEGQ